MVVKLLFSEQVHSVGNNRSLFTEPTFTLKRINRMEQENFFVWKDSPVFYVGMNL